MPISTERSKEIVPAFYERYKVRDVEGAMACLGEVCTQHNPWVSDGPEGFRRFATFLRDRFPDGRDEVKRIIAQHDLVVLHVHSHRVPGDVGRAIMDVFRVDEHGRVVEPLGRRAGDRRPDARMRPERLLEGNAPSKQHGLEDGRLDVLMPRPYGRLSSAASAARPTPTGGCARLPGARCACWLARCACCTEVRWQPHLAAAPAPRDGSREPGGCGVLRA